MSKLIIECNKLKNEQDFYNAYQYIKDFTQVLKRFQNNIYTMYQQRVDYLKPGVSEDNTKAINITVKLVNTDGSENTVQTKQFTAIIYTILGKIFDEDNILSVAYQNNRFPCCSICLIPMDGRKINPKKYLHPIHQTKFNDDYTYLIENATKKYIPTLNIFEESNLNDLSEMGYGDALIEFIKNRNKIDTNSGEDIVKIWTTEDIDSQIQSEMPFDQLQGISDNILTYFTTGPERGLLNRVMSTDGDVSQKEFMETVKKRIEENYPIVKENDKNIILQKIYRAIFQNYILEPLIDDEDISDIKVISPSNIRVKVNGQRYTSNFRFLNAKDYYRFIYGLAVRNNIDLGSSAIHVFSDITSNDNFRMRFNITTPLINSCEFPYLHIRKIAKQKRGLNYLLNAKMLDTNIASYLIDRVRHGKGLIFTGKGASGKTSLMNALLDYIPFNKSGLVIQESEELFSDVHPDLMFQHVTMGNLPRELQYDLKDEARNGLLTDLDYFVIGEVKGAEAKYFINAADTGHRCWCSVHSPSSTDAIDKLADYVMYETKYSKDEATYMLKDLGTVVFLKNFKVYEISEIAGWDFQKKQLIYKEIYKRKE